MNIEEQRRIIFTAMRDVAPGEELTYDYKYHLHGEKIQCNCGHARCFGRMN